MHNEISNKPAPHPHSAQADKNVKSWQRFTKDNRCPVCGGYQELPEGKKIRCWGYISKDKNRAYCTREEHAGSIQQNEDASTYEHQLGVPCPCGKTHDQTPLDPLIHSSLSGSSIFDPENYTDTYDYLDADGTVLFEVRRYADPKKDFRPFRPDGKGGWLVGVTDIKRVLYRLPQVIIAVKGGHTIFVCEGEKDVHAIEKTGGVATCNAFGAGKWREEFSPYLKGADVIIVRHKDEAGFKHTQQVLASLDSIAKSVNVVEANAGNDAHDHFEAGFGINDFVPVPLDEVAGNQATVATNQLLSLEQLYGLHEGSDHEWLWDGRLPVGGSSLLIAQPKIGKTTMLLSFALSVARGEPFLGSEVRQGPVIFIELDGTGRDTAVALKRIGATHEDPIKVYVGAATPDLHAKLRGWAQSEKPALIVIDTLGRYVGVQDGNEYQKVYEAMGAKIVEIGRETGAHVCVVHHERKSGGNDVTATLGSTAIAASVDIIIRLTKNNKGKRMMTTVQRVGESLQDGLAREVEMDPKTHRVFVPSTKSGKVPTEIEERILDYLRATSDRVPLAEVKAAVKGNNALILQALKRLCTNDALQRSGDGKKGNPYRFLAIKLVTPSIAIPNWPKWAKYFGPWKSPETAEAGTPSA